MAPYFGLTGGWLTFWVTVACATDMTLFGYDQGVFGGVVVTPDYLAQLGLENNSSLLGTVTAIYDIGCFFGAILAFVIGEPLGRKNSILVGTTIIIIAGIGNGINTATAPVWQGETSKASWRGKLIIIEMIMNIAGFSLSNWVTYGFSFVGGAAAWRVPLAFQFIFIFILFATVPWLPESPRWLIAKGRNDEAAAIIAALEGTTVDDASVLTQGKEIQYAVEYERQNSPSWGQLLTGKTGKDGGTGTVRRLLLGMGTQAMQQLSGINVTSYYLPTVLIESVGLDNSMARLLAACNSVSYLLFSFIGIPNVERWGRRGMMMYAALGQGVCYMLITILIRYSELEGYAHQHEVASASVAFFFLYYVFFGIGWQGVPWLYPTEINSLSMRTKGAALGTATNWIFNFMVVEITPIGIDTLQWKFYIIWTLLNFAFVPIVYFLYPETAGRTLEDVDAYFRDNHNIIVAFDKEATSSKRPLAYVEHEETEIRRHSSVAGGAANAAAEKYRRVQGDRAEQNENVSGGIFSSNKSYEHQEDV
ncbi:hypothetical protein MBLNU459_g6503t1 [Dothideomycetes sp. NU459]